MFRAIANFTIIGSNAYEVGDTIKDDDNEAVSGNPDYRQFVVPIAVEPVFPEPSEKSNS